MATIVNIKESHHSTAHSNDLRETSGVTLEVKLRRAMNRADYWRRMATKPGYEAGRKKRWRDSNPRKYRAEIKRNTLRTRKWKGRPHACPQCDKTHTKQSRFCSRTCGIMHWRKHGRLSHNHQCVPT